MQTIRYIFSDGTASEIEVTDEFYIFHLQLVQEEKHNKKPQQIRKGERFTFC